MPCASSSFWLPARHVLPSTTPRMPWPGICSNCSTGRNAVPRRSAWDARFKGSNTFVAEEDGKIVAFGNIRQQDGGGYIDMLYTSKDFQGRGAATALCNKMEGIYGPVIAAHSSVTALPFFLSRGYRIVRENTAVRCGVPLKNYLVTKG